MCAGFDAQIAAATHRREIGSRRTPAPPLVCRRLIETDAFLRRPIVVGIRRDSSRAAGLDEFATELPDVTRLRDSQRSAGTAGVGSGEHVGGLLFQTVTGTRFQFVPYRGGGPAMQDLVAGQIDMMISGPAPALPQVRAGSIKAYAVAARSRLRAAPDIPTADEAGASGF